ncbi:hypothetical protein V7S43_012165 [Phytophthora oleae]|uniref:Uncharacterized protein n=1 Tax=Phytophthora oleae TaxID=2107226 RepID=A0ABD3F7F2_9STRA
MASRSLLLFCDFLENRLQTSSLALLRRMMADFSAGNEHTLQDFMRLGASVVSVMPVERTGPRHLNEAARLLAAQQEDNVRDDGVTSVDLPTGQNGNHLCFFLYLYARVATKNILWLCDMFREFCQGDDAVLREFVRCAYAAIAVIPVDIQALCMAPLPPPPLATACRSFPTTQMDASSPATPSAPSPQRKRSREAGLQQQADGEDPGAKDGRARKQARRKVAMPSQAKEAVAATFELDDTSLLETDVRTSILETFKRLEAKEPWKEIFQLENLSMPFSRVRHPELYSALKVFWLKHGRAVWERKFWAPLSRERTQELHNQRRFRQIKVVNFFEGKVITPVYNKLGASFFVTMDARAPRDGWFYFDQAVDLFTLAQRCGLSACLQYMESQAFKRFPVAPGQSRKFHVRGNGKSRSMWSSSERLKPILAEIEASEAKPDDSSNLPSSQTQ